MQENEILRHLEELPAGQIYYISPKPYIVRGLEYYRAQRLTQFKWSKDHTVLTAKVRGSSLYSVSFFMEGKRLRYECSCPAWAPETHCKHVICALATVKNTLNPDLFHTGSQSERYRDLLRAGLLSVEDNTPLPPVMKERLCSIVLERKYYNGFFEITVHQNGRPTASHGYRDLPPELHSVAKAGSFYYNPSKTLLEYLQKQGNIYPLFLKIQGEKVPLEWDPSLVFTSRTGVNAQNGMVTLNRLCISNKEACKRPYLLGENFVADIDARRFGILADTKGWFLWRQFMDVLKHAAQDMDDNELYDGFYDGFDNDGGFDDGLVKPVNIPMEWFQHNQFMIFEEYRDHLNHDLVLSVDQGAVSPGTAVQDYSMTIGEHEREEGKMVLKAGCTLGEFTGSTTKTFFDFLPAIAHGRFMSTPLQAKKRRSVLIKSFLRLLSVRTKNEAEKMIRESLSEGDFNKRAVRTEAKSLLNGALLMSNQKTYRLQPYDGKWYLIKNNREQEALLYTIPYEIFGLDIFREMRTHDAMTISAENLYRHLPALYSRLQEHHIPLFFQGKPVKTSTWDFSFDCRRERGIDWFEVRPEIRCDGELIDDAAWQRILNQNGVTEDAGFIRIVDSNTQEILNSIAAIYNEDKTTGSEAKEIVQVPRLKILDWIYLRNKGVKVRLSKEDEELMERLSRFEKIEERPLPDKLRVKLRHYQKEGYYWLSFLYEHRLGACLADDMGLGKTIQAISLLAGIKEGKVKPVGPVEGPHLIVLPPSLLFNWENEIKRFYPGLEIHFYTGKERRAEFKDCDVVLTTYGLVRRDIERLKDIPFHVIIFDEAQAIKNIYADTTGAVRQLTGYFKLTMTGTPLENHLGEYYSILDLSLPGLLGDYDVLKSQIKLETSPSLEMILRRTRPFVLRRTKEKILKELPPKIESDIYLELTDRQKALYKKTVEMVRSTIADAYARKTQAQAQIIALTAILKLRQLCVSPKLVDPSVNEPSPKIEFLIDKLKELQDEGHGALVFSQFTSFLDVLEEDLKKNGLSFCRLDGSTAVAKRKRLVEDFQGGESASIFLLSLKAGGQGLNLTRASYVFHLDPWWNPAVENQASDRAHRIGQKNKVSIMRILMRHTVEEKMMELKKKKLALYKAVMEDSAQGRRGLSVSKSDFDYLLA